MKHLKRFENHLIEHCEECGCHGCYDGKCNCQCVDCSKCNEHKKTVSEKKNHKKLKEGCQHCNCSSCEKCTCENCKCGKCKHHSKKNKKINENVSIKFPTKEQVEKATPYEILKWVRFLPIGKNKDQLDVIGLIFDKYVELKDSGKITARLSKDVGWANS